MNYDDARQVNPRSHRDDAGRWRYTRMNDGHVWPIGYCAKNCPGHKTAEEAREHYRQYLLDNLQFTEGPDSLPEALYRCAAPDCEEYTTGRATVRGRYLLSWFLCDEHRNRETVEQHFMPPGCIGMSFHS